jgi:flagellar biosynthesis/type III secretory pathway protein FliH
MRHDRNVRFSQPLRAVRLVDGYSPIATVSHGTANPTIGRPDELAAAKELERQEREAVENAVAGLIEAAQNLTTRRRELVGEMQQAAVELAAAIASRVTYDKLHTDRFAIEELVRTVLCRLESSGRVQARMHPDDIALLSRRLGENQLDAQKEIELIRDETLRRGDCIAVAGDVSVISRLEEQLDGIRQHLLRNLADAQVEDRKVVPGDRELRRYPDRRQTA